MRCDSTLYRPRKHHGINFPRVYIIKLIIVRRRCIVSSRPKTSCGYISATRLAIFSQFADAAMLVKVSDSDAGGGKLLMVVSDVLFHW